MSRLLQAMRHEITGQRRPCKERLLSVERIIERSNDIRTLQDQHEIEVVVKLGVRAYCKPEDTCAMLDNVYEQIKDLMYGDFIKLLLDVEYALLEGDVTEAISVMREIQSMIKEPRTT